jgi:dTMP kinase
MAGKLIAIEGIDGSGKSTLVKHLEEELRSRGHPVIKVATRETSREPVFLAAIEEYSLDHKSPEYMFFFQMLHANKVQRVKRALKEDAVVIADRWDFSFFIYHDHFGFFSQESQELRDAVSRLAFQGLSPDLGIYLNVAVDTAFDRRMWRGEEIVDPESEKAFYTVITSAYQTLAAKHNWAVIDANDGFEKVRDTALTLVTEMLQK